MEDCGRTRGWSSLRRADVPDPAEPGDEPGLSAAPTPAMAGSASRMSRAKDSAKPPCPARSSASEKKTSDFRTIKIPFLTQNSSDPDPDIADLVCVAEVQKTTRTNPREKTGEGVGPKRKGGARRTSVPLLLNPTLLPSRLLPTQTPLPTHRARRAQRGVCVPPASRRLEEKNRRRLTQRAVHDD